MTNPTPEQQRAELQAAVAVLTTAYQCAAGEIGVDETSVVFAELAVEHFPEHPVELVLPVAWLALRALSMAARALGTDVPELLRQLGAEAAGPPDVGR